MAVQPGKPLPMPTDAAPPAAALAVRLGLALGLGLAVPRAALAGEPVAFDIPAQPLASALASYTGVTGMAALVDGELATGRRSAAVKGRLPAEEALRILLAGTGLLVRYTSGIAFTLLPAGSDAAPSIGQGAGRVADHRAYFADLQDVLEQTFCRREDARPGTYRAAFQLWIGPDGSVRASHLLGSSAAGPRDAMLSAMLEGVTVAAPPADLPQPVTIVLLPRPSGQAYECRDDARHRR
jgi:hypothetical protein